MKLKGFVEEVGTQCFEFMDDCQQLQEVWMVHTLWLRQLARFEGDRVERASVVWLLQNSRNSQLRSVGEKASRSCGVPHAEDRG